jgi:hypothetical protein
MEALTQEVVPLCVEISLVGQTATHHIKTEVLTRLEGNLARTVGTVHHLHGCPHTARGRIDLREEERGSKEFVLLCIGH